MISIKYERKYYLLVFAIISVLFSCTKYSRVDAPYTSISQDNVYSTDGTAIAAVTALYARMSTGSFATGNGSISFLSGLSADELTLYTGVSSATWIAYYKNALLANSPDPTPGTEHWGSLYNYVFYCNSAIDGLTKSTSLNPAVKQQLLGEAKFLRAFYYFQLVNLYGDAPLVITADYVKNIRLPRVSKEQLFQQIITDLKEAQPLLSENYLKADLNSLYPAGSVERVRPNKAVATALLARVYLYTKDYANAEVQATAVINNSSYSLPGLTGAFGKYSPEGIWQLQPVNTGWNTEDARFFIIPSTGPTSNTYPVYLSSGLLNSFEANDQRKTKWITAVTPTGTTTTYYCPYKYQSATLNAAVTEYLMVFRLGEQYLIRAEARAQLGSNLTGAASDLNAIRTRAGLPNTTATTQTSLLTAILHERQVELFTEWGHRWFDLKRTGNVDAVMGTGGACAAKGGTWSSNWQWYPLPLADIQTNSNLTQNTGY